MLFSSFFIKKSKSNIVSQKSASENMEKQSDGILANTAMLSKCDTGICAVNHELAISAVTSVTSSQTSYKKYTPDHYEIGKYANETNCCSP